MIASHDRRFELVRDDPRFEFVSDDPRFELVSNELECYFCKSDERIKRNCMSRIVKHGRRLYFRRLLLN